MKKNIIILLVLLLKFSVLKSQNNIQYFDGADTNQYSLKVILDSNNQTWQIGMPQKTIFYSANTYPNAIVTDTVNYYKTNDSSYFILQDSTGILSFGFIKAIMWVQKLDYEKYKDGGLVEFSLDSGITWQTAFDNPLVYNFYGFDTLNVDTLANGKKMFTGTDTAWKNVWLCFSNNIIGTSNIQIRFTNFSDSNQTNQEGWLIDNFRAQPTFIHPLKGFNQEKFIEIFPNPAKDKLHIQLKTDNKNSSIEKMELIDSYGKSLKTWRDIPTKYFIDTRALVNGIYILKIKTKTTTQKIQFSVIH